MPEGKLCVFTNRYSEIEGFQPSRTVTYCAEPTPEGVRLSVRQESGSDLHTESCICPTEVSERVASFLRYICENSIGLGNWFDVLEDSGIPFAVS